MRLLKEFRDFALKGNVVDLAIGVIIGAAFGVLINSMVTDILMPPIGKVAGGLDFSNGPHSRGAGLDRIGSRRERAKHIDDDRRPAGCPGARNVIEYLDDQLVPAERLIGTMRARGMKLKSVAVAAV